MLFFCYRIHDCAFLNKVFFQSLSLFIFTFLTFILSESIPPYLLLIECRLKVTLENLNSEMRSPQNVSHTTLKRNLQEENLQANKKTKIDLSNRVFSLNSGQQMPIVQFGTYKMKGEECYQAVLSALQSGYRGIDTASVYDNEKEVGRAITDSGLDRSKIFVQTKLWRSFVGPGPNGKPKCDAELRKSMKKLGLNHLDLWLIHWPGPGRHLNYPPVR